MSTLGDNPTRRFLGMQSNSPYRAEVSGTDGYENRGFDGYLDVDARRDRIRRSLDLERLRAVIHRADHGVMGPLVCGECEQHHAACQCPASVQRATPIRPMGRGW